MLNIIDNKSTAECFFTLPCATLKRFYENFNGHHKIIKGMAWLNKIFTRNNH